MTAPPFTPPPLRQPPVMRSNFVEEWQLQISERGWHITADGAYGPNSERICRNFQREHGLTADGSVGPNTWRATWEAPSTVPPAAPSQPLRRGSTGDSVRRWQEQLSNRGWDIRADGQFGPRTDQICREFQSEQGLTVDGIVGRKTWDAAWREHLTALAM